MTCCIIGKESLDVLESYLRTLEFDAIQNKKAESKVWAEFQYGPDQLAKKIDVVPIKDKKLVSIIFPFPDLNNEYLSQPGHYIGNLLIILGVMIFFFQLI